MNSAVLFRLLFAVCLLGGVASEDVAESKKGCGSLTCPPAGTGTCCKGWVYNAVVKTSYAYRILSNPPIDAALDMWV
ncbi:hypothetical protein DdX_14352 [Ditylenchus destructor]|uniref:Uncharacterized protein n=1 Tax=Ditylenchus destructor TaxID=166010 RepID=A0AAD4R1Y6_9BILA|nr:hypothetical protein DdX_14352 [Ditylenchus destructor]